MAGKVNSSKGLGVLRIFIIILLAAVCCATVYGDWPNPVANDVIPRALSKLTHGPVLGAVTSNSVRVWVRTLEPVDFAVVYSENKHLTTDSPKVTGRTISADDNTGYVEITGLAANTRYYYGVVLEGSVVDIRMDYYDPWPYFTTLPDSSSYYDKQKNPDGRFNVCFSIGHCSRQGDLTVPQLEYTDHACFDNLLKQYGREVMFHIMNGDTIYEAARDGTIEGIRENYRRYWTNGRGFSRLRRYIPMMYTYDDHEIGDNLFGSGYVHYKSTYGRPLMRDLGLKGWSEYCDWANYPSQARGRLHFGYADVKKGSDIIYDPQADFSSVTPETVSTVHVGIYTKGGDEKAHRPATAGVYGLAEVVDRHRLRVRPAFIASERVRYSVGTHFYYDWKVGNCHFFALDMRGERGPFDKDRPDDPDTFILGPTQRKWLLEGVRKTDAQFVFIIAPDPWVIHHNAAHMIIFKQPELVDDPPPAYMVPKGDGYASYLAERDIILDALDKIDKPIIVITGDVHNAMSIRITDNIWEMLAGPMGSNRHPVQTCGGMPLGGLWESRGRKVQVNWAAASPNNIPYTHNRNAYYVIVQVNNVMETASPQVPGTQWVAYDKPHALVRFHDGYTGRIVYVESIPLAQFEKR